MANRFISNGSRKSEVMRIDLHLADLIKELAKKNNILNTDASRDLARLLKKRRLYEEIEF